MVSLSIIVNQIHCKVMLEAVTYYSLVPSYSRP